jgi:hypothetical protein
MAPKFKDPLDEEADAAESSAVSKHAGALAEKVREAREEEHPEVEVKEPDEEEEEEAPPGRAERRSARGKDRLSSRERAAAAEARAQVLQEQLEASRASRSEREPERQTPNQVALLENQYGEIVEQQERLFNEYQRAQNLTPAQDAEYRRRAAILDMQKTNKVVEIRETHTAPQRAREEKGRMLAQRAPDVYANERALAYAAGEFQKRLAMGEADTTELHDLVCEEARQVVLGKRPAPDAAQRQRASGMGGGARPAGGSAPVKLSMPKGSPLYNLARAAYPNDEPGVACQKWANKNGKQFSSAAGKRG